MVNCEICTAPASSPSPAPAHDDQQNGDSYEDYLLILQLKKIVKKNI